MTSTETETMRRALKALAPGSEMREGLERIQHGHTGALIVLGYNKEIEELCSGGFELDVEFSGARLRELSKMDGAVILSSDYKRIRRANVQLIPDASVPTGESGMRHRTAERMARQTGIPVISVSASMRVITVYVGTLRRTLVEPEALLSRANLALDTLDRYSQRLDEDLAALTVLEQRDTVTVRDVSTTLQRMEMIRRIHTEISGYLEELGTEGRLLELQLDDLVRGSASERALVIRDYIRQPERVSAAEAELSALDGEGMVDLARIASTIGRSIVDASDFDRVVSPRGYRSLTMVPRLPWSIIESLTKKWGSLTNLREATVEELQTIEGIGPYRASLISNSLQRQHAAASPEAVGW
ncbi:MAG: DNA integrity scanning diadenylate cyclase DisA [Actinomycetaceae bacterium]|nr:DNA integrity scanning diadenylate cyclase DisA [Actinomycetaceae bacterium]